MRKLQAVEDHDMNIHRAPHFQLAVLLSAAVLTFFPAWPATAAGEGDPEPLPELGWPRQYEGEDHRLVVYQPQIRHWDDYLTLEADAAVLLTPPGTETAVAGAVKLRAQTDTHMDTRTVFIHDVELAAIRMPEIAGLPKARIEEIVRSAFPDKPVAVALDRMLASIAESAAKGRRVELNAEPPKIFVSQKPALIVNLDGEPAWVPSGAEGLAFAANTNWDLFKFDKKKAKNKVFYLRHGSVWLGADDLQGPWGPAGKLPKAFTRLPMDDNFRAVRIHLPGDKLAAAQVPVVFVSTTPAELVVIDGEPRLVPIPDTPVLFVENTEADLFRHIDDGHFYYLVSGRWFRSADLQGPWSAATGELPAGFEIVPEDHAKGHVLVSVPGTPQADEAALQAQIPTLATVDRNEAAKDVKVEYVGEPQFAKVEKTELEYAVNTPSDVIKKGDTYYLCLQGVWFHSASAEGPWQVAESVPKEIYDIPPSSPVHHTTYVYVYDSTPNSVVYGYTPGYLGVYVSWGCVVFGTGWYYPPYYYYDPFYYPYPIYYPYPYPYTYGAGTWYNPATGFYGRGYSYYGPYGGAGRGAAYNPVTGAYARGGYAYGVGGGTAWGQAYNPRTGARAAGYRSADAYSSWGRGVARRGDEWIKSGYYSDARGTVRGIQDSTGRGGVIVDRGGQTTGVIRGGNDLYVGRDGDVYRRGEDGWYKHGGGPDGGWDKVADRLSPEKRQEFRDRAGDRITPEQREALRGRTDAARDRLGERSGTAGSGRVNRDVLRDLDRSAAGRSRGAAGADRYRNWRSSGGWTSGSRGRLGGGGLSRGGGFRGRRGG